MREYIADIVATIDLRLAEVEAALKLVDAKVDHLDEQIHEARRWVDEHKPVLDAGLARLALIADPMSRLRGKRHAKEGSSHD